MNKIFYGLTIGILINLIVVSLMEIAFKGEEYLLLYQAFASFLGGVLGMLISRKY